MIGGDNFALADSMVSRQWRTAKMVIGETLIDKGIGQGMGIGGKDLKFTDGESHADKEEMQAAKGYIGISLADRKETKAKTIEKANGQTANIGRVGA